MIIKKIRQEFRSIREMIEKTFQKQNKMMPKGLMNNNNNNNSFDFHKDSKRFSSFIITDSNPKTPILEADWPIFEMNKINNDQTQPTTKTCESCVFMNDDDVTFQRITIGQFSNSRRQNKRMTSSASSLNHMK
ncbi:hypothetical protein DERP_011035 [Dermatophagoides pteronyssinus]|uniref:Uncharacterized protein n=1 Tax=Dermatophagoides pteronyssinus TaxID=6956 RepID=A0ABQ8JV42_DERPT|nr:hypothetical protein DERP_011035 [Dermatophagoides pteronyssinus]